MLADPKLYCLTAKTFSYSVYQMKTERRSDNKNRRDRSQSLERGLRVLEMLGAADTEVGVRDLAREMKLVSSIVQRLLNSLNKFGFVEQDPVTRKYRIGPRAFEVGSRFTRNGGLAEISLPELQRLATLHRLNSYLGVLRDGEALYVATVQSSGPITLRVSIGDRIPLHTTALGKALLLDMSPAEVRRILSSKTLPRITPSSKTTIAELLADLEVSRQRGFTLSEGENIVGIHAIGAPIRDGSGQIVAAISGAFAHALTPHDVFGELAHVIKVAAASISQRLGATSFVSPGRR